MTGKVKFYTKKKGYGFIIVDETHEEIFVHSDFVIDSIKPNDRVKFVIRQGKNGAVAGNVRLIGKSN